MNELLKAFYPEHKMVVAKQAIMEHMKQISNGQNQEAPSIKSRPEINQISQILGNKKRGRVPIYKRLHQSNLKAKKTTQHAEDLERKRQMVKQSKKPMINQFNS